MKNAILAVIAIVGVAAVCLPRSIAAQAALTPEQTLDRRAIADLEFSPDGSRLVFTVAAPVKGTTRSRSIWLLDVDSGRSRQLTFSSKNDSSPRWAPDGSAIAFLSDRDGTAQLYLLSMAGGEAEKLTDSKEAITIFRWSPEGRRIALLMPEAKPESQQQKERDKDDGRVVDKDERRARVWMLEVAARKLDRVTSGQWQIAQIEWLPAGDRLIASATPTPAVDQWTDRMYAIDATGTAKGAFTQIAAPRGPFGALSVSPDGRTIAFVGARIDGPEPHDAYLQPVGGGAAQNISAATIDRPIGQVRWIDDVTLTATVARGFKSAIATIDPNGRPRFFETDVNPTAYARAKNGAIAFVGETAVHAPEVWIKRASETTAHAVTSLNAKWASIPVIAPELIKYKSFDGVEIEAALLTPRERGEPARPLPTVVLVHGGPTGRWSDSFEPWGQLLAQRGYAVLYPNVRGSTGYGQAFVEANRADWGGGDFKDVMAGVDWAIARGIADANRLGIGGWSYGGYMAAWAVTQTTRFKAAVSGAPVIDMASEFGTENGSAYDEWFYGTPYEKLDGFIKSSPITFVRNVKTPILLLQGTEDTTDPIGQSQQFYRGLKRYGVETELVVYPREPHTVREEKHLLDRLNRIVAWFDKYLRNSGPPTAQ